MIFELLILLILYIDHHNSFSMLFIVTIRVAQIGAPKTGGTSSFWIWTCHHWLSCAAQCQINYSQLWVKRCKPPLWGSGWNLDSQSLENNIRPHKVINLLHTGGGLRLKLISILAKGWKTISATILIKLIGWGWAVTTEVINNKRKNDLLFYITLHYIEK